IHAWIAFVWAVEPSALRLPDAQAPEPVPPPVAVPVLPLLLFLSEPQAASASAPASRAAATPVRYRFTLLTPSSFRIMRMPTPEGRAIRWRPGVAQVNAR